MAHISLVLARLLISRELPSMSASTHIRARRWQRMVTSPPDVVGIDHPKHPLATLPSKRPRSFMPRTQTHAHTHTQAEKVSCKLCRHAMAFAAIRQPRTHRRALCRRSRRRAAAIPTLMPLDTDGYHDGRPLAGHGVHYLFQHPTGPPDFFACSLAGYATS